MKDNPFSSDIFTKIWLKHFQEAKSSFRFPYFKNISFVKHPFLPLFVNAGKTLTKGIHYGVDTNRLDEVKKKAFLIYDVPDYFNCPLASEGGSMNTHKIKQYPGFLIELEEFSDLDSYLQATFKKSSRYKLKKYKKKLETCFDINYKMFYGKITHEEFDHVFNTFRSLLIKRFDAKEIYNNNLDKAEWDFYYEVAYPMILEKKASLFVIYDGDKPVAVTLCYFSDAILFDAITVFDIDYSKFHLGSTMIMKLIEWCLEHNRTTLDFSKGYFDYKKRWANKAYTFEYHIHYDSRSISSMFIATSIKLFFELKQYLRDKKLNEKLHRLTHFLKNNSNSKKINLEFALSEQVQNQSKEDIAEINLGQQQNQFLKPVVFDFLYLNNEAYRDLSVYKMDDSEHANFLFCGKTKNAVVTVLNQKT